MRYRSQLIADASGSAGGLTAQRVRSGLSFRRRTTPTDPSTPFQQEARARFAELNEHWSTTLTQAQRDGWATYAANTPMASSFGTSRAFPPHAVYLRANAARVQSGRPRIDEPPTTFGLAGFTPLWNLDPNINPPFIRLMFDINQPWLTVAGNSYLIYQGRPVNASINRYRGSFHFVRRLDASFPVGPLSPFQWPTWYTLAAGQKLFVRVTRSSPDGRMGSSQLLSALVT